MTWGMVFGWALIATGALMIVGVALIRFGAWLTHRREARR